MASRFHLFVFAFSGYFEKILRREIAKADVVAQCRRPGVLVARGLVGPVLVAFVKATRLALRTRKGIGGRPQTARPADGRELKPQLEALRARRVA